MVEAVVGTDTVVEAVVEAMEMSRTTVGQRLSCRLRWFQKVW